MISIAAILSQQVDGGSGGAYDPWSWITGTPSRADDFTGLALDAGVSGRTLPTGGGTWAADAGWKGGGNDDAYCTTGGHTAKGNLAHADCKIRVIWHPGATGNNVLSVFCRDTQSTPYPRHGFLLAVDPAFGSPPPSQAIALYRSDNYTLVRLGTGLNGDGYYECTVLRDWNVMELRCVGSTITGYLNGDEIMSVTDTAYGTGRSRWGFTHHNLDNTALRVTYIDFTVL